jgi:prepilin-type N-terminal cleavage/methylation domain-containing protein
MIPMWEIGMRSSSGMTLVELLVVMSILALVMGAGVLGLGTLDERRLERETSSVYEWLKTVQREAMLQGKVYLIVADGDRMETRPRSTGIPVKRARRVLFSAKSDHSVWKTLCFFPDGSACPGHLDLSGSWGRRRLQIGWFGDLSVSRVD